jgi:hypothetical protein
LRPGSRLLFSQLDVDGFEALLQQWMAAQPGVTETVDTLVTDGKTLRGSIDQTASGAARFIAKVSLYSNTLGVAIAPNTYATVVGYRGSGAGVMAALRIAALNLLRLAGFQSIREGLQAVMHDIKALLVMAMSLPVPNPS